MAIPSSVDVGWTAPNSGQVHQKTVAEVLNCGIDLTARLASGETISSGVTVTPSPADLTVVASSSGASTALQLINGVNVVIAQAIQWALSAGTAAGTYTIKVHGVTTAGQTIEEYVTMQVVA